MNCPWCDNDCSGTANYVDIGVGSIQCSPHVCDNCHAVEIGAYDDGPFASEEWTAGWSFPVEHEMVSTAPKISREDRPYPTLENRTGGSVT